MNFKSKAELPSHIREILADLPNPSFKYGDGQHPMFKQWRRMIDCCSNPTATAFANFGGRGITVAHDWYEFGAFVEDMQDGFEVEPSKPAKLRRNYLARRNLRAGFNLRNCFWTTKAAANSVQAKTVFVDTAVGKGMTFRQLAEYLKEHAGEEFPEGMTPILESVRSWNPTTQKTETVQVPVTTIQPVRFEELRRRHRLGLPLLAPVKPRGRYRDELVDLAMDLMSEPMANPNL